MNGLERHSGLPFVLTLPSRPSTKWPGVMNDSSRSVARSLVQLHWPLMMLICTRCMQSVCTPIMTICPAMAIYLGARFSRASPGSHTDIGPISCIATRAMEFSMKYWFAHQPTDRPSRHQWQQCALLSIARHNRIEIVMEQHSTHSLTRTKQPRVQFKTLIARAPSLVLASCCWTLLVTLN